MQLITKLNTLKKSKIKNKVETRLKEFEVLGQKGTRQWFSELCFCILTANSKAKTAISIQKDLGVRGFCECSSKDVKTCIMKHKHRFHNNKTKFIVEARKYIVIKEHIQDILNQSKTQLDGEKQAREFLVKNIKGLGYKEASHFLRNLGFKNLAILDRHIINLMLDEKIIKEKPKILTKKVYLEIEKKFSEIAKKAKMNLAELDLYMWYMKTGEILK